jgi:hypothetical protein
MEKVVSQNSEPSRQQETKLEEVIKPNVPAPIPELTASGIFFLKKKLILIKNKVSTKRRYSKRSKRIFIS